MPRIDILIAALLATATSAGGYDLQSPATREMAANECVLDSTKDSDVPLAGLRAYCQCTVDEMAKQLPVQEVNKYGDVRSGNRLIISVLLRSPSGSGDQEG